VDHRHAIRVAGLSIAGALCAHALPAQAQAPAMNFGHGLEIRFENSTNYDSGSPVGQTKLLLNSQLDTNTEGPFVVTLEQARRVLATGSCNAQPVVYSGEVQPGQGYVTECSTNYIPSANIRTTEPVDVVLAMVDDATDARTELYRGTFPVIAFNDWKGNDGDRSIHVEQRALRLDSFYSVGFVRQYMGSELEFSYVTTQNNGDNPDQAAMRCRVGTGEWRAYETSVYEGTPQTARNRVFVDGSAHEDGPETVVTKFMHFSASMPIAVRGRSATPSAGSSMDGAWTCELRFGGAGSRVVTREFHFNVASGYIVPSPLESQLAPGRGTVLVGIGLNPEAMPAIFDPALVRDSIAGRRLTGATAPLTSALPARAVNPAFTVPRAAAPAAGGRGGRRR